MPAYDNKAPGVYIEKMHSGSRSVAKVGTSLPGFVGVAPAKENEVNQAISCNNWAEFCKHFVTEDSKSTDLSNAVFSCFNNGCSRCYVVNIGKGTVAGDKRKQSGLYALETIDEIAIVAAPGFIDPISQEALITHCENLGDRIAILDAPEKIDNDNLDLLKELNTVSDSSETAATNSKQKGIRPRNSDEGYAAYYFPWFKGRDALQPNEIVNIPPSGAIAGIYGRTDATRGVHKAPANEVVRGAIGLCYNVSSADQGSLNKKGVNIIRLFPDGYRVWGARTLAAESSEWRYISVRRTCNMIKESIEEATRWTVFEPNDKMTWKAIERDIRAFLLRVWRDGALLGATPEQAFFVKCDAETNPAEERDAGKLVTIIGISPVKPAEFVIFRLGQKSNEPETTTE